jgi:hypothetical protein
VVRRERWEKGGQMTQSLYAHMNKKKKTRKTTLRFHLIPIRIAIIKNTTTNRCGQGCEEKGSLVHC